VQSGSVVSEGEELTLSASTSSALALVVRTRVPLRDPDLVFSGLPAVDSWQQNASGAYTLSVSDPTVAAPALTRALVAAGADVLSLAESHHSLEDVYLELIDEDVEAGTP